MPAAGALNASKSGRKFISWSMLAVFCFGLALIEGCSIGPKYTKPIAQTPPAYKEIGNWKPAEPSDAARKENWWEVFTIRS